MNDLHDWQIAHEQRWYRIPVSSQKRLLKDNWPPRHIAFYQTKSFGDEKYAIRYYAEVTGIEQATRRDLFPEEPLGPKSGRRYHKLSLGPIRKMETTNHQPSLAAHRLHPDNMGQVPGSAGGQRSL